MAGPNARGGVKSKKRFFNNPRRSSRSKRKIIKINPFFRLFKKNIVKVFAGLRPETQKKDFYIDVGEHGNVIHVSGIRSPGLTAAPAIAKYVVEFLITEKKCI